MGGLGTAAFGRFKFLSVLFIAMLIFFPGVSVMAGLRCASCAKAIPSGSRYLTANGKEYCGMECFRKTLPKCEICGKPCERCYVKNGKKYCSKECLNQTLPKCAGCGRPFSQGMIFGGDPSRVYCKDCAAKTKCFSCQLPADCARLDDGRNICPECAKVAVYDRKAVLDVFLEVRRKLKNELGVDTHDKIKLEVVDSASLKRSSPHYAPGEELGLYLYKCTVHTVTETQKNVFGKVLKEKTRQYTDNVSYTIYVLYGIPKHKLSEVLAHELAHDWMQKHYPGIDDLKIKEGWAEYVASRVNLIYGRKNMNLRMEKNPDKIYGDGYRMIKNIADRQGMDALENFFKQNSSKNTAE